jgi:hypothetical protein
MMPGLLADLERLVAIPSVERPVSRVAPVLGIPPMAVDEFTWNR